MHGSSRVRSHGPTIASVGEGTLRLWDARSGRSLAVLGNHAGMTFDVARAPDGRTLLTDNNDGTVQVRAGRPLPRAVLLDTPCPGSWRTSKTYDDIRAGGAARSPGSGFRPTHDLPPNGHRGCAAVPEAL